MNFNIPNFFEKLTDLLGKALESPNGAFAIFSMAMLGGYAAKVVADRNAIAMQNGYDVTVGSDANTIVRITRNHSTSSEDSASNSTGDPHELPEVDNNIAVDDQ